MPNQTASQKLSGLITQGKEEKIIWKEGKECIVFEHEDFGGQLVWALERYVSTNVEGPESAFFNTPPPQQPAATGAAAASSAAAAGGGNTQQQQAQEDEVEENLPSIIQDLIEWPHLENDEEAIAAVAAPMVDDDNEPALENQPNPNETVDDIFSGWYQSGICHCQSMICHNAKPELKFWRSADVDAEPSNIDLFLGLFFSDFIKTTILPQTNNNLKAGNAQVTFGEFIQWIGLWLLMSTLIGPQHHEFWSSYSNDTFKGSNRNMSKLKGWTLQGSLLTLWLDENSSQQSTQN